MELASSGSDSDSSGSDDDESIMGAAPMVASNREANRPPSSDHVGGGDDQSSDSSDDDNALSSSSSDENSEDDEEKMTLAERIQRQAERGVDLRARRERKQRAVQKLEQARSTEKRKKKSKHAPAEVSSKRSDFYKRRSDLNSNGLGVDIGANRYKPRDPRGNNLNGHLDIEHFENNFSFLQEMRQNEIALLKKKISARKKKGSKGQERRRRLGLTKPNSGTLEEDQEELKRLLHEKAEFSRRQVDRAAKQNVKKQLQSKVESGASGVYFPKRKELKRMHVQAKFEELRKRGGDKAVERAMAKRRKKNKSKDTKLLGGRPKSSNTTSFEPA